MGINLSPDLLKKIDKAAEKEGVSGSRYIVRCTERVLSNGDNTGQQPGQVEDKAADNALIRENDTLKQQVKHNDEIIRIKEKHPGPSRECRTVVV